MGPTAAGPSTTLPQSDLTFIITADQATFQTPTMLKLHEPSKAVPYFSGKRVNTMALGACQTLSYILLYSKS